MVMVLADVPSRDRLVALAHSCGYDAWACTTPLEAVHVLERHRPRVRCALIAPDLPWGSGVGELLDDEYPDVDHLMVSH